MNWTDKFMKRLFLRILAMIYRTTGQQSIKDKRVDVYMSTLFIGRIYVRDNKLLHIIK